VFLSEFYQRHHLDVRVEAKLTAYNCSTYQWPDIKGLQEFKGQRVHSAHWDHDFDYSNKRIAVVGNGSSGVQIVPQMAKLPGTTVTNFVRGPSWIYYRVPPSQHLGRSGKSGNNPNYTEEERKKFREEPETMRDHRRAMIARTNKAFRMVSSAPAIDATCDVGNWNQALIIFVKTVYQRFDRQQGSHGDRRRADA
jgi:cation diffusion facilitator CzcD-associated flavoprotein CzcO